MEVWGLGYHDLDSGILLIVCSLMGLIVRFFGSVGAVLLAAYVVPGFVVANFYTAAIVALILGIINITIKPILTILTLPLNLFTLGLFSFVINAALILFVSSFVQGFHVSGFLPALLGGAVIAVVQWLLHKVS